jgi:succinate dehydrogenase / fumarate reductase cytochrome b subunit
VFLKPVIAITGFVWFGFLLAHLGSNLRLFWGAESLNGYYAGLKANGPVFWGVRVVLATSVALHIAATITLIRRNAAARPVAYAVRKNTTSTLASRTMRWTGPVLGMFILYHLLHFTTGDLMPAGTTFHEGDDYRNIVSSFSIWYIALLYVSMLGLLGMHLWHGAWAATLSLGARYPTYDRALRLLLLTIVGALILGMLAIPLAPALGFLSL